MVKEYDVIVIGCGVAGALIAWKLAAAKRNVLILDAGEKRMDKTDRAAFVKVFAEAVNDAKSPSEPYVDADNSKFAHSPDVQDFMLQQLSLLPPSWSEYFQEPICTFGRRNHLGLARKCSPLHS